MKLKEIPLIIPLVFGLLTILLGIFVDIGWIIHSEQLIRIANSYAPMQFNTGLCFIFSGTSLLLLYKKNSRIAYGLSIALLLISGLTLLEYIFEINLYIDELFIESFATSFNIHPGRMAPNTALSFFIFGLSILKLNITTSKKYEIYHLIGLLIILSLSFLSIFGYFTDFTTNFGLGQATKMSLYTALGLIGLSTGLILCLYFRKFFDYRDLIPVLLSFILLNATFLSWQAVKQDQELHFKFVLKQTLNSLSSSIKTYMAEQIKSFRRISNRWINQPGGTPRLVWEKDVLNYIKDQPGYVAIEWVDNQYLIRWVEPKIENEHIIGYNLYKDTPRRELINKSLQENQIILSPQIDLIQGGKGILLLSPLKKGDHFEGIIVGVINSEQLFKNFLNNFKFNDVYITVKNEDEVIYTNLPKLSAHEEELVAKWIKKEKIDLFSQIWQIEISPKTQLLQDIISPTLPLSVLILGTVISILTGLIIKSLLSVIKLQYQAASANEQLKGIIEGSTDYIAALDTNYRFIIFNKLYQAEVFRLFRIELQLGMNINVLYEKMSSENMQKTKSLWQKALQGKAFSLIESFNDKRHSNLHYEIRFNPIKDANNKLIGASHIAKNISQRIANEKEMASYKQRLEISVQTLKEKNEELQLLKKFITILSSFETIEQTHQTISTYIDKLLPNTSGAFYLLSPTENHMEEISSWNKDSIKTKSFGINDCLGLLQNHLYFVEDTNSDLICNHLKLNNEKPNCYLCMPLFAKNNLLGLIYVEFITSPQQTTVDFIQIICEQLALVVYNIQLKISLKTQSIYDALTGLHNRRYIEEYLEKEIKIAKRHQSSFAVILMDIDHFKAINDTYGHLVGDQVLCYLSEQLHQDFRESDLIGRWGGEEFIVLLKDISVNKVQEKAEQFRNNVSKIRVNLDGENIFFTISLGISLFSREQSKDQIIKKADDALYQAKTTGRNKVVVNSYDIT